VLLGAGVAPGRIIVEPTAQNTHEQAEQVADLIVANQWYRALLIASTYHTPRAFLTFLRVLMDRGLTETVHLLPVPTSQSRWWEAPKGMEELRLYLLDEEMRKIEAYQQHVATWTEGIAYLRYWEDVMGGIHKHKLYPEEA